MLYLFSRFLGRELSSDCTEPKIKTWLPLLVNEEQNASSTIDAIDLAISWYKNCVEKHKDCSKSATDWFPTRLLDIGSRGSPTFRLISSYQLDGEDDRYMTLSYCWGKTQQLVLTTDTMVALRDGMAIEKLPKTFREAMLVAHAFGVRYLWIDSLCIIQDSEDDWEKESLLMCQVYSNSTCNIAASDSEDVHGGLFRERNNRDIPLASVPVIIDGQLRRYRILDEYYWDTQVKGSPLHRRGWVFQECLLAPRILFFTRKQLFWQCSAENSWRCEACPEGIPIKYHGSIRSDLVRKTLDHGLPVSFPFLRLWSRLIDEYCQCELTFPEDKMIALNGVLTLFQDLANESFVAGCPMSYILESLDWRVYEPKPRVNRRERGPSWSWISIDGALFAQFDMEGCIYLAELLKVEAVDTALRTLSFDSNTKLQLRGLIRHGEVKGLVPNGGSYGVPGVFHSDANYALQIHLDTSDTVYEGGMPASIMPLKCYSVLEDDHRYKWAMVGLVLRRSNGHASRFERIGFFGVNGIEEINKYGIDLHPVGLREGSFTASLDEAQDIVLG